MRNFLGMVVTDLDGTLLNSHQTISQSDVTTLKQLGEQRILRVIATGRSLFSARKVLSDDLPIDFLIFSTGCGILDWRDRQLIFRTEMGVELTQQVVESLIDKNLDFMVHKPVPNNHQFFYFSGSNQNNSDFWQRCKLYQAFATPFSRESIPALSASQLLVVADAESGQELFETLHHQLANTTVIRTTSPLDHKSVWIEIFASGVNKSMATQRLYEQWVETDSPTMAIGNDYNDADLLDWAMDSFVVTGAPSALEKNHTIVASNNESAFSQAVKVWKERKGTAFGERMPCGLK